MPNEQIVNPDQTSAFESPWSSGQRALRALWEFCWFVVFCQWTPKPFNPWRLFWLRVFEAKIEGTPFVHWRARIAIPSNLTLHDRACLGDRANAYSLGEIEIGERATVAQEAYLSTGSHDFSQSGMPLTAARLRSALMLLSEHAHLFCRRDNRRAQRHRRMFRRHRRCTARCLRRGKSVSDFAATMSTRVPVSVIVPIKNEAANLPRCLACCEMGGRNFRGRFPEHRWLD